MRVAIGVAAFALLFAGAVYMVRLLASAPPSDGAREMEDVSGEESTYRCSVCGTEVRLLRKPHGDVKPPRHCGEAMEAMGGEAEA